MWKVQESVKTEVEFPWAIEKKSSGILVGLGFCPKNFKRVTVRGCPQITFVMRLTDVVSTKQ